MARNMQIKSCLFLLLVCLIFTGATKEEKTLENKERIFNGDDVSPGEIPYFAFLIMSLNKNEISFCGGSLIYPDTVITAAHCCLWSHKIVVFLGETEFVDTFSSRVQKFEVLKDGFTIHENFSSSSNINDICLLHLPESAELNQYVNTIELPNEKDMVPEKYDDATAVTSGFGQTSDIVRPSSKLQRTTVHIDSHARCTLHYSDKKNISSSQICSSKVTFTGPCQGDSGGPLMINELTREPVLIGLSSWVYGECTTVNPVVYTYVPAFIDWIHENIKTKTNT